MNNQEKKMILEELEEIQYYLEAGVKNIDFQQLEWSLNKLHALTMEMRKELKETP